MDPQANPFGALSLIVAPAILTNAASVLAMSTSNRLARAVDRARELARQLEGAGPVDLHDSVHATEARRRLDELTATEQRAVMLLQVLRSFYVALGGFALATLASLIGAVVVSLHTGLITTVFEMIAVTAGAVAVASLVRGSALLVRETGIAVQVIHERASSVRQRLATRGHQR
jgi:hypothetical protein